MQISRKLENSLTENKDEQICIKQAMISLQRMADERFFKDFFQILLLWLFQFSISIIYYSKVLYITYRKYAIHLNTEFFFQKTKSLEKTEEVLNFQKIRKFKANFTL